MSSPRGTTGCGRRSGRRPVRGVALGAGSSVPRSSWSRSPSRQPAAARDTRGPGRAASRRMESRSCNWTSSSATRRRRLRGAGMKKSNDERRVSYASAAARREQLAVLLYDSAPSGNCYKTRLLLSQLGISFERVEVDTAPTHESGAASGRQEPGAPRAGARARRRTSPRGVERDHLVPRRRHGVPPRRRPSSARRSCSGCSSSSTTTSRTSPSSATGRCSDGLDDYPDSEQRRERGYGALVGDGTTSRDELEFFVGERYSIADIALYAYTHVARRRGFDLAGYPAINAWLDRVAAEPGHITIDD